MRAAVFALALLAHASTAVAADDEEHTSRFEARPTAMYIETGIWAPLGFGGFEVEHAVLPVWTLSAGVGLGAASLQGAAMTRLRLGGDWSRAEIGAGVSYGKHVWQDLCGDEVCAQKGGTVARANDDGRELLYTGFGFGGSF